VNFYWVYDIPNWLFAVLTIGFFVGFALVGQRFTRRWVKRIAGGDGQYNELVGTTLATVGVFFGMALGLISVGTWQTFADSTMNVNQETTAIAVLYRSVSVYDEPDRTALRDSLKEYVDYTIHEAWPIQRKGEIPTGDLAKISDFQKKLVAYETENDTMNNLHALTLGAFNNTVEHRRTRMQNVTTGLPDTLWYVVIFGALLNIFIPWFLVYDRQIIQDLMIVVMASTIGLLIFMMGAMDNPFRGEFSVSSEAFESLLKWMQAV
jgi:Protein of unknown function (DUF4239)